MPSDIIVGQDTRTALAAFIAARPDRGEDVDAVVVLAMRAVADPRIVEALDAASILGGIANGSLMQAHTLLGRVAQHPVALIGAEAAPRKAAKRGNNG